MKNPGSGRLTPVILCGGVGSRLWPLSRSHVPKQFISLISHRTMLQETVLRVSDPEIYNPPIVVCGEHHRFLAAEQLRQLEIKPSALIIEPAGRGTAAAIALGAFQAMQSSDPTPIIVLPADQAIAEGGYPIEAIATALAAAQQGRIVTLGIKPDHPATGYGYITVGEAIQDAGNCFEIEKFIEKPEKALAIALVEDGQSLWNAGVFIAYSEVLLAELEVHSPAIVRACKSAISHGGADLDFFRPSPAGFDQLPAISIDYAVMEHTQIGAVVPIDVKWSDVGSWMALWQLLDKDDAMNAVRGPVHSIDSKGCLLRSEGPLLATIGVEDLIVVADTDAILVAKREDAQRVREMFDALKRANRPEVDTHRTVLRPWGSYASVEAGDGFQVKRIVVKPHEKLSLQKHQHRAEHWVVVRGEALVTRGKETFRLLANQSTYIPMGEVHRLENDTSEPLHLIEVQSGSYLGEDDIIRIEDNYGRKGQS
jgi:mannose-1-phosphate guanylyltransferase/mannose-6-phosphate isomerase